MEELKNIHHFQLIYDQSHGVGMTIAKHFGMFSRLISLTINTNGNDIVHCNELPVILIQQNWSVLQRLHLHGNIFDQDLESLDNVFMFHFPSLRDIHVCRLHVLLAIELLDQCPQLYSFSATLYGQPTRDNTAASAILLPTRVRTGLVAMKKLDLGVDNDSQPKFDLASLELLLSCCPNLRTFGIDVCCHEDWEPLLDTNWWTRTFALHDKLKRISLHLHYTTRDEQYNGQNTLERFRSSLFFTELEAEMRYDFSREFMRFVTYDLYIKN
jgi:hypothetical protein